MCSVSGCHPPTIHKISGATAHELATITVGAIGNRGTALKISSDGARLLVTESHNVPLVSIEILIGTGVDGEPEGKAGLAGFTASLLREGTKQRPPQMLAGQLEDLAARLETSASLENRTASTYIFVRYSDGRLAIFSRHAGMLSKH